MEDGRVGEWHHAPGAELLTTLRTELGKLPLIAEDLGLITPEVTALREEFGLPGMKILQFAFGDNAGNPYLPHHHEVSSVAYTGTHDNDTTAGWISKATEHELEHLKRYFDATDADQLTTAMVRAALGSVAKMAILPAQDLLALTSEARFNTPGTVENNWCWRLDSLDALSNEVETFHQLNVLYGR